MARTAPVPDIPPIPGMCPSIAVLAGGGDGGGGSGEGAGDGSGDNNADGSGSGEAAAGDARGAPDYQKYPGCGYASHPVDVVTGRAFTHPIVDLALPGPLPLVLKRMYSSKAAERDTGLGFGWAHTFGWAVEVGRRQITVWNEQGIAVDFPVIPVGGETLGPWGWVLRRETWGFAVDADDGLWHLFSAGDEAGKRFLLTAIQDRNKNRISITYEDHKLVEIVDCTGRTIRVLSNKEGRIASLQVKNAVAEGRWVAFATYAYDDAGNLVSATDADGFSARYAYDEHHRLVADADRTGLTFHFRYDGEGRCIESWGDYPGERDPSLSDDAPAYLHDGVTRAKGVHHCKFEYFPGSYSEVADSTQVRRYFGTAHGTLSKSVVGSDTTTSSYRDDGHLLAETDALGATRSFDRDRRGRLLKVVDPLGRLTVIERDANGLPVQVIDPAGETTMIARDNRGNALFVTDPTGGVTAYRYDERGLVTEMVSPTGLRRTCAYDPQGNLTSITEPSGVWRFLHDGLGRLLSRTDPLGGETRYIYSQGGSLVGMRDALGALTRYTYDGEGHLTQIVDAKGRITVLQWGGYQKLCGQTDANGDEVRLRYNREGELVQVFNERGEVHALEYDSSGRLIGETTFDGRELRYRHDKIGRVIRTTNGLLEHTGFTYDLAGQLIQRDLPDGSVEEFSFDARGALSSAKNPAGELRYERDAAGRIVREVQIHGEEEHWIDVVYDPAGERVGRTTSLGHTEVVERGAMGERKRTVLGGDHVVEHRSDALGREIARALPGGGWIQSTYDAGGRIARRQAGGGAPRHTAAAGEPEWLGAQPDRATVDMAYRYDWDGELIESQDRARGSTQYQYDPIGQLLAMIPEKARSELFRYDSAGNLHEMGAGASVREYAKGSRLLRKGGTEYRWDGDGRLVEKREKSPKSAAEKLWKYQWDGNGLLKSVDLPDGRIVEFVYDPFARRLQKRVTRAGRSPQARIMVSETRFVWDRDVLVHEITTRARESGDPVVEERTYWFEEGGFEPMAHREVRRDDVGRESGGWFHYVNDPIGTPERLLRSDGTVACELRRKVWGEVEAEPGGEASTALRFQGQYADVETGLAYNRFRYFDPEGGRFIGADPALLRGGLNQFAYRFNPVAWVDPLGLITVPVLAVPVGSPNIGRDMNRAAVPHLLAARAGGASASEMGDMYEGMAGQIKAGAEANGQQWGASRLECSDGSHAFAGEGGGRELVITPDRRVHVGPPGLIRMVPTAPFMNSSVSPPRLIVAPPNIPGPAGTNIL